MNFSYTSINLKHVYKMNKRFYRVLKKCCSARVQEKIERCMKLKLKKFNTFSSF